MTIRRVRRSASDACLVAPRPRFVRTELGLRMKLIAGDDDRPDFDIRREAADEASRRNAVRHMLFAVRPFNFTGYGGTIEGSLSMFMVPG